MSSGPVNTYHRRLVKDTDAKACWICYKPSSTVLSTPDNTDWFYICPGHLTDVKFAIPKHVEDLAQHAQDAEIEREMERVTKEFAEKMKKKMERQRIKEGEKDGKNVTEEQKKREEKSEQDGKEEEEKKVKEWEEKKMNKEVKEWEEKKMNKEVKELEEKKKNKKAGQSEKVAAGPRIFELHKNFFQMRLQKKAQAAQAKRLAERLRNPSFFPSVPQGP